MVFQGKDPTHEKSVFKNSLQDISESEVMKHLFISLLNFNGKKNTLECLESLKAVTNINFKLTVIIVNNSPSDSFVEENKNLKLKIIENEKNLGFSGGHNVGIEYGLNHGADYILILNNDTFVDKNFIQELLKACENDEQIGITVPKIYFAPGFEFHKNRYTEKDRGRIIWYAGGKVDWDNVIGKNRGVDLVDNGQFENIEETEIATGCAMMIKKEVFEKVGFFDEKYFLYYEDSDLSLQAKKKGFKIVYVPKALIWHKNAGSVGGPGSTLQDYYITRNRLLFGMRYASFRSKFALIRESLFLLFNGRKWQKRGIWDFYVGKFGKGSFSI